MLVLSRKRNQKILLDLNKLTREELIAMHARGELLFKVVVADMRGDKVRLGVDAPKSIPVHRDEVYEAIQRKEKGDAKD